MDTHGSIAAMRRARNLPRRGAPLRRDRARAARAALARAAARRPRRLAQGRRARPAAVRGARRASTAASAPTSRYDARRLRGTRACAASMGFGKHVHEHRRPLRRRLRHARRRQQRWLPRMASGEAIAAIAMSEPGAGSDLQGVRTRAVRDGDALRRQRLEDLHHQRPHRRPRAAGRARPMPQAGAKGISLLMVETAGLAGFRRGRILDKIGQKAQDTAELFFDDVRVPAANLLGGEEGTRLRAADAAAAVRADDHRRVGGRHDRARRGADRPRTPRSARRSARR